MRIELVGRPCERLPPLGHSPPEESSLSSQPMEHMAMESSALRAYTRCLVTPTSLRVWTLQVRAGLVSLISPVHTVNMMFRQLFITVRLPTLFLVTGVVNSAFYVWFNWSRVSCNQVFLSTSICAWMVTVPFRFRQPKSDRIFGLTQANFEANSAYFLNLTEIFGIFN